MRRTAALALAGLALLLAACGDDADEGSTPTTVESTDLTIVDDPLVDPNPEAPAAGSGDPFDPAANTWITATIGGGNERLNPGGVTVEISAAEAEAGSALDQLARKAAEGNLVEALTTGGAELECAAAFDGPSYEITLHLTSGDVTVGTCGLGEPLVDTATTATLISVVDAALQNAG